MATGEQRVTIDGAAIEDDFRDSPGIPDALRGVAVDHEQVGAASGGDQSELIPVKLRAVVGGRGGQCLTGRKSKSNEEFEFGVQANAGQRAVHGGP